MKLTEESTSRNVEEIEKTSILPEKDKYVSISFYRYS